MYAAFKIYTDFSISSKGLHFIPALINDTFYFQSRYYKLRWGSSYISHLNDMAIWNCTNFENCQKTIFQNKMNGIEKYSWRDLVSHIPGTVVNYVEVSLCTYITPLSSNIKRVRYCGNQYYDSSNSILRIAATAIAASIVRSALMGTWWKKKKKLWEKIGNSMFTCT